MLLDRFETRSRGARLSDAGAFALQIHAEQRRMGSDIPDISHLLEVAGLVLEHGGQEEPAMAGLSRDAVKDQRAQQLPAIRERFGACVAAVVEGCSDADTLPEPPWRSCKEN